ncbi:MAG: hypothetical protein FJW39_26195 [Acidobacteria bacterium]|nr:hypothetical protein [Acidobacteriota bacterium]
MSSFLLFLVQPMIARRILPAFGGSTAVWTTCMLFFQFVLLAGYLYSDRIARRSHGGRIHAALLALGVASVPLIWVVDPVAWAGSGGDPVWSVLAVLAVSVGIPYFLLSTTGPLVQAWFGREHPGQIPYRLFSLSNFGSFAGLLSYPVLIEPSLGVSVQLRGWAAGFACFAALCAWLGWRSARFNAAAGPQEESSTGAEPSAGDQALWIALAAAASALLLSVTNHITQNIAPIPFLWVLPLTLYLLTFVLCFGKSSWTRGRKLIQTLAVAALGAMTYVIVHVDPDKTVTLAIPVLLVGLFIVCTYCHGELAARKPPASQLTRFYLMLSIGGAAGALLVAIAAPRLLKGVYELPIALCACAALALMVNYKKHWLTDIAWTAACVATLAVTYGSVTAYADGTRVMMRNFYGAVRVTELKQVRSIIHGTINHGVQRMDPPLRKQPTTYYGRTSGGGLAIEAARRPGAKVGVIGLGAGTLAVYANPGDHYKFYEINPEVVDLAHAEFTFLRDCAGKTEVLTGDGRLLLAAEPPQQYDVLVVDAFSGDSIPVHLLTREATELYRKHLRPDGILAMHISNTHLDLQPVVARLAGTLGRPAFLVENQPDPQNHVSLAYWAVIPMPGREITFGKRLPAPPGVPVWTDDFSNLVQVLRR